jgi:hypothetical protein
MKSPRLSLFSTLSLASLLLALALTSCETWAGNTKKESHQKVIDFEGDLVEGVNKRPWDSLSQISDKNARRRSHLYQKRKGFRTENRETLQELRYQR